MSIQLKDLAGHDSHPSDQAKARGLFSPSIVLDGGGDNRRNGRMAWQLPCGAICKRRTTRSGKGRETLAEGSAPVLSVKVVKIFHTTRSLHAGPRILRRLFVREHRP